MSVDRCICCGAIIPEGVNVCPNCLLRVKPKKDQREMATEKRLIDADALIDRLKFKWKVSEFGLHRGLESAIAQCNKAPTVDAVEVVRCKDCKNYFYSSVSMGMRCRLDGTEWGKDDFCSCGERKNQ